MVNKLIDKYKTSWGRAMPGSAKAMGWAQSSSVPELVRNLTCTRLDEIVFPIDWRGRTHWK